LPLQAADYAVLEPMSTFSLCVYCGSRSGVQPDYLALASKLGQAIGRRGWQLVYGGGRVGLMGAVADAALAAGARVVGVIPQSLMRLEVGHPGLSELHVVQTMHERKQMMAERAHAFVALPGGIGTFEELFEVWTWRHLGYHQQPIGLLDAAGYYTHLITFLQHTRQQGFVNDEQLGMLQIGQDVETLLDTLYAARAHQQTPPLDRI